MTKALKEMILGALEDEGGQDYLRLQARENPVAFMSLLGKVLPTTVAGDKDNPILVSATTTELQRIAVIKLIAAGLAEDRAQELISAGLPLIDARLG